ncbi:glycosyltransferase family 4 protein [Candidatus Liberibacter asiaticus]|uniref:Group 1 glycosyl transferase n=1 Tax=Candidatus Liberibacter asiaticus str. gxpsy TaxID=1174529 RepID=A0ABM5NEU4_LIBAS|nr:glycosyltransferase family 4 protein [Candidatus Liberibacter asiaticus]AGH16678.1 group 1 glycosyl transferase [Candidatus Liberibacter asiaticus str. gxpsy]ALK07059.1 glycosyltransferase [Candidatus Liberibacter asiaticus]ASK52531.1 glycosyl transferase family 1 [Candidatus Liberibacter asiaticus]AWL13855.1 glycosyltransferase family 1 protein [Candidatus Liberibacter asiaticus]KAE9510367.1 D-inositol 3-phosphate glycosyltransferase [Candidatus Liberibacter asiaticus]
MDIANSKLRSSCQPIDMNNIDVIAPNMKFRHTGVTSTVFGLCPIQRKLGQRLVVFGYCLPKNIPSIGISSLLTCWKKPIGQNSRIWHARRNNEMLLGVMMRDVLRMPLKLVFTSPSQRNHSRWTRYLISRMDEVITTSQKSARFIERPSTVIMHGVDTERFRPTSNKQEARRHLKISEDAKLIGCFGRIRKLKGTDLFVDCMINILPHHPGWTAVVVGKTTLKHYLFKKNLQRRIYANGLKKRILFIDEQSSIEDWYRALNIFVAPPLYEGFGLTPLEAMASGIPVVASNTGVFSELLDPENAKAGVIVPPRNLHALEKAVLYFMNSKKIMSDTGNRGRERAVKHFSIVKEASDIGKVYDRLLRTA